MSCPFSGFEIDKALYWTSFRETPEYYNYCSNLIGGIVGVPTNFMGYQYPHSGDAYAGLIPFSIYGAQYNELMAVPLTSATVPNQKYYCTFYISFADISLIACNKIGIKLSTVPYSYNTPMPLPNFPIAYSDSIYTDTLSWHKINLSFIADSIYQYLILGNFYDNTQVDTIGSNRTFSYYYFDDVCLSMDSAYCSNFTGLNQNTKIPYNNIIKNIFYSDDKLKITFNQAIGEKQLLIYTETGQLLQTVKTKEKEIELVITQQSSIYLIRAFEKNKTESKKIITIKN